MNMKQIRLILIAIGLLALTADAASLVGSQGTLTVDERGVSLAPRDPACPTIVAHGGALWTLMLQTSSRQLTLSATGQKAREETTADGIRLVYKNLTDGTNTWKIGLTLDIRSRQDTFEIGGELRNETDGAMIRELTCPALTGIAATPATHPLLWPNGLGQRFTAASKPGERAFSYPSRNGSMQWCAFAGERGGLYVGSHDAAHGAKTFTAQFDAEAQRFSLAIQHQPFCGTGQRWTLPPTVLLPYAGTWHVVARHYRAWFDSVSAPRPSLDWVRDASGWLLCILKQQNGSVMWNYPALEQLCDVADQRGLDILGLFGWAQGGHDHLYPDYIPDPQMGGPEALRRALAAARRRGKRTILYANGQLIDTSTEFYRAHGKDVAVQQENGTPVGQDWQKYKSFPAVHCVLACQSAPGWHERMRSLAIQAHELGADGILYDQLGMTGPVACWATNHGHPAPTMVYAADRAAWLRRLADEMKRIAPNFIVMTEGLHDSVLDSIELFHGCVLGEFIPTGTDGAFPEMFRFTFSEVISTQRHPTPMLNRLGANYACLYGLRHEIESRYAPDVRYLKEGVVPTRGDYSDILNPPNVPMMATTPPAEATGYLKRLIEFERHHAALLWRGRFVDDQGFNFKGEHLVAKAYAAGNQLGVLVWNQTDKPATFTLTVPQARLVTAAEPERDQVEAFSPLPGQTIRLLVWEKQKQDVTSLQARPSPDWLTRGVMYQVWLRSFTPESTLRAATKRLPQVAELGANIIYLSPVCLQDADMRPEFWSTRQKASGTNNPRNPYRIKDYNRVDPEYGSEADLRQFIATAHKLGLRVLMDLVYFHCGPTSVLMKHPEYFKHDAAGKISTGQWNFPVLDFKNQQLREHLWANMEHWVKDFDVDGFRCDVSDAVPLDFWEEARTRLEPFRPDLVMLAEGRRKDDQIKAFDINYNFWWHSATMAVFRRGETASSLRKLWEKMRDEHPRGARFIRYTENHDIVNDMLRAEVVCGERGAAAMSVINFTLDGVPLLYNGQEIGDTSPQSIYARWPVRWEAACLPKAKAKFAFHQKLCQLRRTEPALTAGEVIWLDNDQPDAVVSFLRRTGSDEIVTVVNLSNRKTKVQVELPAKLNSLLADGAKVTGATLDLEAFGYFVGKKTDGQR